MKTLVVSAVGPTYKIFDTFVFEWAISLRYLSKYKGDVLLLDYGLDDRTRNKLKKLDITLHTCSSRGCDMIDNTRYIDMFDIINEKYFDYNIAFFDIFIWFQDKLDSLFYKIDHMEDGILFSTTRLPSQYSTNKEIKDYYINHGPNDPIERIKIGLQYIKIMNSYGGPIDPGFFAGKFRSVIVKLVNVHQMYARLYDIPCIGTDGFFINMLFDFNIDQADAYKWNCTPFDRYLRDNIFYSLKSGKEEKVVGVHCVNDEYRFRSLYPRLFKKYSK